MSKVKDLYGSQYTIDDVVKHPIDMVNPVSFFKDSVLDSVKSMEYMKTKNNALKKLYWFLGTAVLGSYTVTPVHEHVHSIVTELFGGKCDGINMNSLWGGDFVEQIISFVYSRNMPLGQMASASFSSPPESTLGKMAMYIAPYVVTTPLGITLVREGSKRKNMPFMIYGGSLVLSHIANIPGDFKHFAKFAKDYVCEKVQPVDDFYTQYPQFTMPSLYLGAALTCMVMYRVLKGLTNSGLDYVSKIGSKLNFFKKDK